jgi:hypothetical protein
VDAQTLEDWRAASRGAGEGEEGSPGRRTEGQQGRGRREQRAAGLPPPQVRRHDSLLCGVGGAPPLRGRWHGSLICRDSNAAAGLPPLWVRRHSSLLRGDVNAAAGLLLCGAEVVRSVRVCAMERKLGSQGEVNLPIGNLPVAHTTRSAPLGDALCIV